MGNYSTCSCKIQNPSVCLCIWQEFQMATASLQAEFFTFAIERGLVDPEDRRCVPDIRYGFKHFANMEFFHIFKRHHRADLQSTIRVSRGDILQTHLGGK